MSTTIDQRVVEMRFDNAQFENNVKTSMSTLEKLKQSLNLNGAAKGLESIGSAAKGVTFNGLGSAVESVHAKFSALEVMGVTALANITNSAVNAGKKITSALTIDPIKTGFQEYETQINAVQTILANTESKGTTLQQVNSALDQLNAYADKTIYNFTEMTRNIGTFTAAGVDLDTSVSAIQGIANLAAVSGSNAQQASTAMYQLSQALASGTVKLMDWNSVVNAGMGGEVFQNALKETARVHGVAIDKMIKEEGSFRETLSKGWLTSDILTETLNQFTMAAEEGSEEWETYKKSLMDTGYTEKQAIAILKMANTATDAATKVKTFSQLWDTLKEAAQSGWTQSWEIMIGDFEEAKSMLTDISDRIGKIIGDSAEARNNMLSGGLSTGWKQLLDQGIDDEAGYKDMFSKVAEEQGVSIDKMIAKEKKLDDSLSDSEAFQKALTTGLKDGTLTSDMFSESVHKLAGKMSKMSAEELKAAGYTVDNVKNIKELSKGLKDGSISMDEFTKKMMRPSGRENIIQGLWNTFDALMKVLAPVKEAFREIFPRTTGEQLYQLTVKFRDFTEKLKISGETADKLKSIFKGIFSTIDIGIEAFKAFGKGAIDLIKSFSGMDLGILDAAASIGDYFTNLRNGIIETDLFGNAVNKAVGFLAKIVDRVKNFGKTMSVGFEAPEIGGFIGVFKGLWNIISSIGSKIPSALSSIITGISDFLSKGDIFEVLNTGIFTAILLGTKKFTSGINDSLGNINGVLENVTGILDDVRGCFQAYQEQSKAGTLMKIATAIGILAASIFVISTIDEGALSKSLGGITVLFAELIGSLALFSKLDLQLKGTGKAIVLMNGMAVAILVLSFALKNISSLDTEGIVKGLVGIGVLMAEISLFLNTAKFDGKVKSTAVGIVILSAALLILTNTVKALGGMDINQLTQGLISIGVLLAEIVAFTKLTSGTKAMVSMGAGLILLGASMKIFASAVKDLGSMDVNQLTQGLIAMGIALAEIAIATQLMPKNMIGIGAGLLIVSAAMLVLSKSLNAFSGMSWDEIARGLAVMAGSLLILSLALIAMKGTLAGSAALLIAATSLAIIAPVLKTLGSLSWEAIVKGLVTLAGAFAVVGIAALVLTPIIPSILGLAAAFALFGLATVGIGAGLLMISAGFTALATATAAGATAIVAAITVIIVGLADLIPTIAEKIGEAIVAFAVVIGECAPQLAEAALKLIASVLDSLATYTPQIVSSLLTLLIGLINGLAEHMPALIAAAVNLIGSFLEGIISALNGIDGANLFKTILAVTLITGLMYALSGVVALIPTAMAGVLGVGLVVAELALVLAAIGALSNIPGLQQLITDGGNLLQSIGTAIGQFVGGIIGGFGSAVSSSLPGIGANLSQFMTNLMPFINGIKMVDSSILSGAGYLSAAIVALGAAKFISGVTSFLSFGSSFADLGTQLSAFMINATPFIRSASMINEGTLTSARMIADLVMTLTKADILSAVTSFVTGSSSFESFGSQLTAFGKAIVSFSNTVSEGGGINESAVTAAATAGSVMAKLQSSLEPTGGVVRFFSGQKNLATFGKQLTSFGKALNDFAEEVNGLDGASVTAAANAGLIMAKVQQAIPENKWFDGKISLSSFGKKIKGFGKQMAEFSDEVSGIDTGAVNTAVTNAQRLVQLMRNMNGLDTSGIKTFKSALSELGKINYDSFVESFNSSVTKMTSIGTSMTVSIANGISSGRTKVVAEANGLVNALSQAFNAKKTSLDSFGSSMMDGVVRGINKRRAAAVNATVKMVSEMLNAIRGKGTAFENAGSVIMNRFIAGISKNKSKVSTIMKSMVSSGVASIRSYYTNFYSAGAFCVDGFCLGITANTFKAEAKAAAMAEAALEAARKALREKSPSKAFYEVGDYAGQGFVNALDDSSGTAYDSGYMMADYARKGLSKAVAKIQSLMNTDMDIRPTISPVVDLSNVESGTAAIRGMFGQTVGISASTSLAGMNAVDAIMRRNSQNGSNADVVAAIDKLRKDIRNLEGTNNTINGLSYGDDSGISEAIGTIVRAARIERRM